MAWTVSSMATVLNRTPHLGGLLGELDAVGAAYALRGASDDRDLARQTALVFLG